MLYNQLRLEGTVMEQLRASQTAMRVALQRAVHQVLDDEPRVFSDPVAVGLFPEATEAAIRRFSSRAGVVSAQTSYYAAGRPRTLSRKPLRAASSSTSCWVLALTLLRIGNQLGPRIFE